MRLSTESLARAASRRPWRTLAAWLVLTVVAFGAIGALLGDALTGEPDVTSETDSKRAYAILAEAFPHDPNAIEPTEAVVVRADTGSIESAPFATRIERLVGELEEAGVRGVVGADGESRQVSEDGDAVGLALDLGPNAEDVAPEVIDVVERLDAEPGYAAGVTGDWTLETDFGRLAEEDLRNGELFFGAPAALVVLLLVFGAVVAGLIPLVLALISIFLALALTALLGLAFEFSDFVTNMIFGMGLALGIDYALFVVSRYREERSEGREKYDAIATAGSTASRAVLFSGLAFVLAMFGLLLVPNTIMRSLAAGAILVGITSILAALTLLPAVLGLLGDRVNALRLPYFGRAASGRAAQESRFWARIVRAVMARPVLSLAAATILLVAAAVPLLGIQTGTAGISTIPDRFPSKQGFVLLNEEFPGRSTDPVEIVVVGDRDGEGVEAALGRLTDELAASPLFGEPAERVSDTGAVTHLTVDVAGDPTSTEAVAAVRELRHETVPRIFAGVPAEALVTGDTAEEIDYFDVMKRWLPIVFVFVLGLSFVLLTIAFRSIVLPAKAILLNLLSVGAAYGLLVLVFVEGVGNEIFGFQQVDTVEAWVPLFLFAVLFGLSMDYQVFLLSRIRERFSRTGSNEDAISFGVGSTARLITGAALIIIAVFAGFARGDLVMFQQMGFGVAVALLLDATIVRSVLVPASMKLLGRWNWYLPSWLAWLPDPHVEGREHEVGGRVEPAAR